MKLLKLTASSFALLSMLFMASCEPDAEQDRTTEYEKKDVVMSSAQEPQGLPVPSSAIGKMDVYYSKSTRTLTYKVTWSGLTDSLTAMHIHGLAPTGFNAAIVQHIISGVRSSAGTGTNNAQYAAQNVTNGPFNFSKTGSISGSFQIDGVLVKEEDVINGLYYMNIHTKTNPGGEIRGQIRFQ